MNQKKSYKALWLIPLVAFTGAKAGTTLRLSYEWGPDVGFLFIIPVKVGLEWHPESKTDYYLGIDFSMQPLVWMNQIGMYAGVKHEVFLLEEKLNYFNFASWGGGSINTLTHTPKFGVEGNAIFAKGGPNFNIWNDCKENCTLGENYLKVLGKKINFEAGWYHR